MARKKTRKDKNGNYYCPHCDSSDTYQAGGITFTTEQTQIISYWCSSCNQPFTVERMNGKDIEESL